LKLSGKTDYHINLYFVIIVAINIRWCY